MTAGFAVSTIQWMRADRHAMREAGLRTELARELYTSDMIAVQQAWEVGNVKRMGDLLRRHEPEPGETDWRGFEWYVFQRHLEQAQPIRTFPTSDVIWGLAATPNGQTVAALVYVHAPDPSDECVEVTLWDAASDWKPRTFRGPPSTFGNAIALTPDGAAFASGSQVDARGSQRHLITIWDAATGRPLQSGPGNREAQITGWGLAFSPDGKKLLWGDADSTVYLWDRESGAVQTFIEHKGSDFSVAFDPRGRWIASASDDGTVKLWDLQSRHVVHSFPFLGGTLGLLTRRPIPRRGFRAPGARMWDLTSPREPREIELRGGTQTTTLMSVSFSPDGLYLAAGSSNTVRLWEVASGEARATLKGHSSAVAGVAFLDGGRVSRLRRTTERWGELWDVAQALG